MKEIKQIASACRYCRYYQPEGRRGGTCQRLGAPVLSHWKACGLALPPFAPSWESLENAWNLTEPIQIAPLTGKTTTSPSPYSPSTYEESHTQQKISNPSFPSKSFSFVTENIHHQSASNV